MPKPKVLLIATKRGYTAAIVTRVFTGNSREEVVTNLLLAHPEVFSPHVIKRQHESGHTVCLKESPEVCVSGPTERQAVGDILRLYHGKFIDVVQIE